MPGSEKPLGRPIQGRLGVMPLRTTVATISALLQSANPRLSRGRIRNHTYEILYLDHLEDTSHQSLSMRFPLPRPISEPCEMLPQLRRHQSIHAPCTPLPVSPPRRAGCARRSSCPAEPGLRLCHRAVGMIATESRIQSYRMCDGSPLFTQSWSRYRAPSLGGQMSGWSLIPLCI